MGGGDQNVEQSVEQRATLAETVELRRGRLLGGRDHLNGQFDDVLLE